MPINKTSLHKRRQAQQLARPLAVSQLLAKPDGSHRQDWLDQPNCGSCHSGNGAEAVAKKARAKGIRVWRFDEPAS